MAGCLLLRLRRRHRPEGQGHHPSRRHRPTRREHRGPGGHLGRRAGGGSVREVRPLCAGGRRHPVHSRRPAARRADRRQGAGVPARPGRPGTGHRPGDRPGRGGPVGALRALRVPWPTPGAPGPVVAGGSPHGPAREQEGTEGGAGLPAPGRRPPRPGCRHDHHERPQAGDRQGRGRFSEGCRGGRPVRRRGPARCRAAGDQGQAVGRHRSLSGPRRGVARPARRGPGGRAGGGDRTLRLRRRAPG